MRHRTIKHTTTTMKTRQLLPSRYNNHRERYEYLVTTTTGEQKWVSRQWARQIQPTTAAR